MRQKKRKDVVETNETEGEEKVEKKNWGVEKEKWEPKIYEEWIEKTIETEKKKKFRNDPRSMRERRRNELRRKDEI